MAKSFPIVVYAALASLTLVGVVAPPQTANPAKAPDTIPAAARNAVAQPALLPPPIAFDVLTPLVLDRRDKDMNPSALVVLKNDGPKDQTAQFSAVLLDRSDGEVKATVAPARRTSRQDGRMSFH